MLTDLFPATKFIAAIALSAFPASAPEASAQSTGSAVSDRSTLDLREAVTRYFNVAPEQAGSVEIRIRLDKAGAIVGSPEVMAVGGNEAARKSLSAAALRAVLRAAPFTMLPKDKYESWKEVVLRFETGDPTP